MTSTGTAPAFGGFSAPSFRMQFMVGTLAAAAVAAGTICVAPTARAADPGAKAGRYVGTSQGHYRLAFTVRTGGRSITGFDTGVVVYCRGGSAPSGPEVRHVALPTITVAKSGTFNSTRTTKKRGTYRVHVSGDIDGGTLTRGRLTYHSTVGGSECTTDGPQQITAKRR